METKAQAFHRLAGKRVEAIEDAMRIFGNLAGPSYEWTPDEVLALVARIEAATAAALARFQDTRRWPSSLAKPVETPIAAPAVLDQVLEALAPAPTRSARRATIAEAVAAAHRDEPAALAELIAMQGEVIENLQTRLDGARS